MKKKNFAKRVNVTALAALLCAGIPLSMLPETGVVVVQAENQDLQSVTVVDGNTNWKYLDNNTDPAEGLSSLTAWTEKGFDDTGWKSSTGKFGAKRGALTSFDGFTPTVLLQQYIEGTSNDIPAYFFRTTFSISDVDKISSITGTLFHDDAVAVYINGHRVASADMPADAKNTNMFYAGVSAGAPKELDLNLVKENIQDYLINGENVLSVELHNDRENSSDIYFEFQNLALNYGNSSESGGVDTPVEQKSVFLTVGSDTTSQGISWYTNSAEAGEVQYALKNGETFPENYQTAVASSQPSNENGFYSNQATLANLQPGSEYVYRVVNGTTVSKTYSFKTSANDGNYSFAFVGDPQIGAGGNVTTDTEGWNATIDTITTKLNPDFVLSAGDQVNTAANEIQYAGYLNETFASLASATSIGNHDSSSAAYNQHFNLPNESADKGITNAGSDYWFVYENTLFIDINSNNRSNAEHKAFIEEAINANPDVKWKTVVFHHSIYSTASHVNDSDIISRREELPQIFTDLDIDVVLMGHDHVYTRTYMMNGFVPDSSNGVQSSVTNPTGILYLTANSASGSKYYDIKAPEAEYSAKMDQSYRRTVTDINVTDTSYKMTTYYADTMEVLDDFTIYKADNSDLRALVEDTNNKKLVSTDYTAESWAAYASALENANLVIADTDAKQEDIDAACTALKSAIDSLKLVHKDETIGNGNQSDNTSKPENKKETAVEKKHENSSETAKTSDSSNVVSAGLMMLAAGSIAIVCMKKRKA